jgi:hypothetical protein
MAHNDHGMDEHLEDHSLPGMNQAGEGPDAAEEEGRPRGKETAPMPEKLEEHSLPGMNQAGEGPEADEEEKRPSH